MFDCYSTRTLLEMWTIWRSNCTKIADWIELKRLIFCYLFIYRNNQVKLPPTTPKNAQQMYSMYVCASVHFFPIHTFVWFPFVVWANIKWYGVWGTFALRRSINVSVRFDRFSSIWFLQISKSAFKLTIVHRLKLQLCMVARYKVSISQCQNTWCTPRWPKLCADVHKTPSNLR